MRNERGEISQVLLAILSIILAAALLVFLYWNRSEELKRTESLKKELSAEATESVAELGSDDAALSDAASTVESEAAESQEASDEVAPKAVENMVISVRGDGFYKFGDPIQDTNLAADLVKALADHGITVTADNYTLDMAGTLTQMQHAGVDAGVIAQYVEEHTASVNEAIAAGTRKANSNDPDTVIRSEKPEQLARNDQASFPIIGIGYTGGYMDRVDELIAQQELILGTYENQTDYLILGYYPASFDTDEERAAYDAAMTGRWGVHYLDINPALQGADVRTKEVRERIAQMIAEKLTEE